LIASEINLFQIKVGKAISIFMPFIIGFTMAYLFNFILKFYEENLLNFKIFNDLKPKIKRLIGLILTYATVVLLIYSFLKFIFPQVLSSIMGLVNDIPYYVSKITVLVNDFNSKYEIQEEYYNFIVEKWTQYRESIIKFATDLIPILGNTVKNILSSIWNIVLGLIISIYLLTDKEKVMALSKKVTRALFSEVRANRLIELVNRGNNIFGKFLIGKILDSFIIGILTFVVVTMAKMPYTILISFIIGITNIIPFFGPFIGAIPSAIIILFISPVKAFWFLVIVLVIQQIDGNIIGPKILGDSLGISAFWILFSLLITGKLFGLLGMIIGVPLFVFIYSIIKEIVEDRLKKKGLPCETDKYI